MATWTYKTDDGLSMEFEVPVGVTEYSADKLIERIKEVRLRNTGKPLTRIPSTCTKLPLYQVPDTTPLGETPWVPVYPYKDCAIRKMDITDHNRIYPAQRYVLKKNLTNLMALQTWLQDFYGLSIFNVAGWIELRYEDGTRRSLLPPVIEHYSTLHCCPLSLICDGMHRMYLARQMMRPISVVIIDDPTVPYYAYPLPDGWAKVKEVDEVPEGAQKKLHRFPDYKSYYRDFNTAFPGTGDSRPSKKKEPVFLTGTTLESEVESIHREQELLRQACGGLTPRKSRWQRFVNWIGIEYDPQ